MATIVLSAAGAAIGGSIGGSVLGLSSVVIGRFVGAAVGRVIDQKLMSQRVMGQGSDVVDQGRVDRFRLTGVGEGQPVAQVYGRARLGGQVIWASAFREHVTTTVTGSTTTSGGGGRGGKGAPARPTTTTSTTTHSYSYSVSLAVAICEGVIGGVLRVWADGVELAPGDLNWRVYLGTPDQRPDPKIEAVEGAGTVPAYRGTAYVVFEDLSLEPFGNRVPQFSFEVVRPDPQWGIDRDPVHNLKGVALLPGTGEYALATQRATLDFGYGHFKVLNENTPTGRSDMVNAVRSLRIEAPNCRAVSMIVGWFGDDLRAGSCTIRPKVEQAQFDAREMPWRVSGLTRAAAQVVPQLDGQPVYGGTPDDASVVQAIAHLRAHGQAVMFYPFILMDQLAGNGRTDPYGGAEQAPLPWRGRITGAMAPGLPGSSDGTVTAEAEVAAFMGGAKPWHFGVGDGGVGYYGPEDWGYRRFILHYAALCAAAGGVDSFCIGSEMRGLTTLRGASDRFPYVTALRALAADVRAILGPGTKIGYAADWSEYFGYQPQDGSGDRYFHLDPLWADPNIDFIGIDNYMPLSDWRDGEDHADAGAGSIYALEYLKANVAGGEGYDWFYEGDAARAAQIRTPITDDAHGEPWVWRYKDIRNWWDNLHHERIGGVRQELPTGWVPRSKPVWFTELGCAAIDKGTNQPNKFLDPKSSESAVPYFSDGRRDEVIQMQYLRAMYGYWNDPAHNPVSEVYGGRMVDMDRAFVWAWDARPFPTFPGLRALWSDGANYGRGHWISGRVGARSLASVIEEICRRAGVTAVDVSRVHGVVRGYIVDEVADARAALQPLMLAYGVDAVERDGVLAFRMRAEAQVVDIAAETMVETREVDGRIEVTRAAEAELAGRVRLRFVEAEGDYPVVAEETVLPDEGSHAVSTSEMPLVMTRAEGRQVLDRWLSESRVARDVARFALPPSLMHLGAGDVVQVTGGDVPGRYRIDRVEQAEFQIVEAVRSEPGVYRPSEVVESVPRLAAFVETVPVLAQFLDLPLMRGDELPHAPYVAATADPWPGVVAVYGSSRDANYALDTVLAAQATMGVLETPLYPGPVGRFDRAARVQLRLTAGALESVPEEALLDGANLAAVGDGSADGWELIQFANAEALGGGLYEIDTMLRGQLGSDGQMRGTWPPGSRFVLLDGAVEQIGLPASSRGVARYFRVGPASRPLDDPAYTADVLSFAGVGLRPYAPAHLRATRHAGGDLGVGWIRRTRVGGDSWDGFDVPLGEERESYVLRVLQDDILRREVMLDSPGWTYPAAQEAADTGGAAYHIEVAQVSATVGAGYAARVLIGG